MGEGCSPLVLRTGVSVLSSKSSSQFSVMVRRLAGVEGPATTGGAVNTFSRPVGEVSVGESSSSASQSTVIRELAVDMRASGAWSVLNLFFRGGEFGLNSKSSSQFSNTCIITMSLQ